MPSYAGYLCWQGVVEQADLPAEISELLADRTTIYKVRSLWTISQGGSSMLRLCGRCATGVPRSVRMRSCCHGVACSLLCGLQTGLPLGCVEVTHSLLLRSVGRWEAVLHR